MLCLVAQSCLTLCDPTDCSLSGSSVHGDSPGKNRRVSELPLSSPEDTPDPGIKSRSSTLQVDSFFFLFLTLESLLVFKNYSYWLCVHSGAEHI